MSPKIRNIIIFVAIAAIFVFIYIFFFQSSSSSQPSLVSSSSTSGSPTNPATGEATLGTQYFLTLLLNVKTLKLDDSIFSDPAFASLHDSSITLTPDATTGRPNPFAQFGTDVTLPPGGIPLPILTPPTPATTPVTTPPSTTPTTGIPAKP